MDFGQYVISTNTARKIYWFTSTTPKGKNPIVKLVSMQPMERQNRYNLALASIIDGKPDYFHQSKNKDLDKILGTIGKIVKDFTTKNPGSEVFVTGNTASKTRLYQMQIANNLAEIKKDFNVYGTKVEGGEFEEFKKGETYVGFLVSSK